jgi:hypothetical protein
MIGFSILAIGIYEGGYNHLLPNIQYAMDVESTLREGLYVPPDDFIFQGTGMAQFVIAVIAAYALAVMIWGPRRRAAAG